jgi:hypothetical protein
MGQKSIISGQTFHFFGLELLVFVLVIVISLGTLAPFAGAQENNILGNESTGLKNYKEIVTKGDILQEGIFNVHHVGALFYVEIPKSMLGRDMLWYSEIDQVPFGVGKDGLEIGRRAVRLERFGDHILVKDLTNPLLKRIGSNMTTSKPKLNSLNMAVEKASLPAVLMSFPVLAEGENGSAIIDVTGTFANDIPEFSPKYRLLEGGYNVTQVDPERSSLQEIKAFARNIEIRALLTYNVEDLQSSGVSIIVRHSITRLPDKPMTGRYFDPRVGYFTTAFEDYFGQNITGVSTREFITRYRLEKTNPNANLSEPVTPIVFYVSQEVPDKWRPYIKKGIEDWQPAFEAAGFKNAIIAKDAPSNEDDPDWDPADTRFSVIRWVAQDTENAMGPNIVDPRSGEVLSAHVEVYANVLKLEEKWYFLLGSADDPHARKLPLPDEVIGDTVRCLVTHEVGHSLGLRHNFKASQAFTVAQLRNPKFTNNYGPVASIMSYGRINYVAQPEDNVTQLLPKVGPYDLFAIRWGYRPIPSAKSPADEASILDSWAAVQVNNTWLAFGGEDNSADVDPTVLTENIGSDRINSTALGIANLERVMKYIVPATTNKGGDFQLLADMYVSLLDTRYTWLSSVVKEVGGVVENRTLAGRGGAQYSRVSKERQHQDVQFLMENLRTPKSFLSPDVINLITPQGGVTAVQVFQKLLLNELLSSSKLNLLAEGEILDREKAYTTSEFLDDMQNGLWEELAMDHPVIDPMHRDLQIYYLSLINQALNEEAQGSAGLEGLAKMDTGLRGVTRSAINQLGSRIDVAIPNVQDENTRMQDRKSVV